MSAPSAVRTSKQDWVPGRFHRIRRATGWGPQSGKDGHAGGWEKCSQAPQKGDPGNRRCVSGTQVGGLPGQLWRGSERWDLPKRQEDITWGYFSLLEFLVSLCEKFNEPIYKANSTNGKKQKRVTSQRRGQRHFSHVIVPAPVAHHVVTMYAKCVTNTAPHLCEIPLRFVGNLQQL